MDNFQIQHNKAYDPPSLLVFLTNRVGKLLGNAIRKRGLEDDIDMLPTQMGILADLWTSDGQRQQDLAISLIKDKATITRALDVFEKDNIVVRVPDPNDKRNKRIYLTHKGKEMQHLVYPYALEVEEKAVAGIDKTEIKICKKVLRQIYDNLTT